MKITQNTSLMSDMAFIRASVKCLEIALRDDNAESVTLWEKKCKESIAKILENPLIK